MLTTMPKPRAPSKTGVTTEVMVNPPDASASPPSNPDLLDVLRIKEAFLKVERDFLYKNNQKLQKLLPQTYIEQ